MCLPQKMAQTESPHNRPRPGAPRPPPATPRGPCRLTLQCFCRDTEATPDAAWFPRVPVLQDYLRRLHRGRIDGTAWPLPGGQAGVFSGMLVFVGQQRRSWEEEERGTVSGAVAGRLSVPSAHPSPSTDLWRSMEQNWSRWVKPSGWNSGLR